MLTIRLAFVLSCTKPVSLPDYEFPPHLGGQETPKPNPEPGTGGGKEMTVRLCSYNVGTFSKSKSVLGHYSYPDLEDAAAMVSFGCRLTGHEDLSGESGFDAMGYDAITLPGSYRESPIAPRHILESFSYRFLDRLER